jgi:acyl-coenzyme A synthetase/AMP-(fatty) acid ligase
MNGPWTTPTPAGATTGSAKLPTVLHMVDALPRHASGKVMKTALRRQFGAG